MSSIIVLSGVWDLYKDYSFVDREATSGVGSYPNADYFSNDSISSLRPAY